jgi:NAD(P)-dependent dehydrogenase (short-subunit alcohol dehydrogenase family)
MVNIKGSTVVVTGGQRGLGKAIVDELLRRGAPRCTPRHGRRSPVRTLVS